MGDGTKTSNVRGPGGKLFYLHEETSARGGGKTQPPVDSFSLEGGGGKVLTAKGGWGVPPQRTARVFRNDAVIPTTPPPAVPPSHIILVEAPDFDHLMELRNAIYADHGDDEISLFREQAADEVYNNELRIISGQFAEWREQTRWLVSAYVVRLSNLVSAGMEPDDGLLKEGPEFACPFTIIRFIEDGGIPFDRLVVLVKAMRSPVERIRDDAVSTSRYVLGKFIGAVPYLPNAYRDDAREIHAALNEFGLNSPPTEVIGLLGQACVALTYRFGFSTRLV